MNSINKYLNKSAVVGTLVILLASCTKFTEISLPATRVETKGAFADDNSAASTIAALYTKVGQNTFATGATTTFAGISSDELIRYNNTSDNFIQIANNVISPDNTEVSGIWTGIYSVMAQANACLEGLRDATALTPAARKQLTGEALFVRAYCYFYLHQFYGEVPLNLSTDWASQLSLGRTPVEQVQQQIIKDLKAAKDSLTATKKVRATKLSCSALLARMYLYRGEYDSAIVHSTAVIDDATMPKVLPALNNVFLIGSTEAIMQLIPANGAAAVPEASQFYTTRTPIYYVAPDYLASFEANDQRKTNWTSSVTVTANGVSTVYSFPFKYKSINYQTFSEYYVLLRLAEQYLIRAEARAQKSAYEGVVSDLNVVRTRAGLTNLSATGMNKGLALAAVMKERKAELFAEWGHRWFDLIRTGAAATVLKPLKAAWTDDAVLFPVPNVERSKAPQLTQNKGYAQ